MSEFLSFLQLGFRHIVGPDALDHIVFLVVLAAAYRLRDARALVWVVTAFTIGHSITLALSVTGVMAIPTALVEFLIPLTIVVAAGENLLAVRRSGADGPTRWRPLIAGGFGLIHGAGFANYLRAMFVEDMAIPLLGFNVGIEAGQLVVLCAVGVGLLLVDRVLAALRPQMTTPDVHRLRVACVSLVVMAFGSYWAVQRIP